MTTDTLPKNLHAQTIDEVIGSLDRIVGWSKANNARTGYFAALYRKVTVNVKEGIEANHFDDGQRMQRLDVIFANRYLDAFEAYYAGQEVSRSWQLAFRQVPRWFPLVLQHLMLGMNAHINLDLGIAAAQTVAAEEMSELKSDFDRINDVLASLVDEVQNELARIWPLFKWLDKLAGRLDEKIADMGMVFARDQAWDFALEYAAARDKNEIMQQKDHECFALGSVFMVLGVIKWCLLLFIRLGERGSVTRKIEILE